MDNRFRDGRRQAERPPMTRHYRGRGGLGSNLPIGEFLAVASFLSVAVAAAIALLMG